MVTSIGTTYWRGCRIDGTSRMVHVVQQAIGYGVKL